MPCTACGHIRVAVTFVLLVTNECLIVLVLIQCRLRCNAATARHSRSSKWPSLSSTKSISTKRISILTRFSRVSSYKATVDQSGQILGEFLAVVPMNTINTYVPLNSSPTGTATLANIYPNALVVIKSPSIISNIAI